jgi:hypothetical protein
MSVIPELPIGLYRVTCSAPGFQQAIFDDLEQSVGHTLRLDITLPIGGITQQVNVSGINDGYTTRPRHVESAKSTKAKLV